MKKEEKKLIHKALDGDLSKAETRRFARKLESDGRARSEFEQLKKVVKDTEKIRIEVPPGFTDRVLQETTRIRRTPPSK
jgi:anti-sigma factor RsiW